MGRQKGEVEGRRKPRHPVEGGPPVCLAPLVRIPIMVRKGVRESKACPFPKASYQHTHMHRKGGPLNSSCVFLQRKELFSILKAPFILKENKVQLLDERASSLDYGDVFPANHSFQVSSERKRIPGRKEIHF